mgnify:CR=1 FL=1
MSERPEWFELTEGDKRSNSNKQKPSRNIFIRALAIGVPLVIVGSAMVFAEGDESDDAPKMDTTIPTATTNSSANSPNSTTVVENASTSNRTSNATSKSTAKTENISINSNSSKTTSNVGVANPATNNSGTGVGVPKPSGRGGDDGGHEGRERRHGEGHEGGEHEFGGDDD